MVAGVDFSGQFISAVIVAGGSGSRFGADRPKQYLELVGKTVLETTVEAFYKSEVIDEIIVVVRQGDESYAAELLSGYRLKPLKIVCGGEERQDSVLCGVSAADERCTMYCIHDAARPLVSGDIIRSVAADALRCKAATAAVPVKDTIKKSDNGGFVERTLDRGTLWSIQTPQIFDSGEYLRAVDLSVSGGNKYTDDCQLIEAAGGRVKLTMADYSNFKITTPEDLIMARAIIRSNKKCSE